MHRMRGTFAAPPNAGVMSEGDLELRLHHDGIGAPVTPMSRPWHRYRPARSGESRLDSRQTPRLQSPAGAGTAYLDTPPADGLDRSVVMNYEFHH